MAEWPGAGLACLPNFAFSLPLGRWLRARQRRARLGAALARRGGAAACAGASGAPEGDERAEEAATDALQRAVLLHPLAIVQLMERCGRCRRRLRCLLPGSLPWVHWFVAYM